MADFAAVIRRAVDGLAENTPEMRVKVYEKARGAVQRQLESMKPRPPEDMLRRQLDKLELAIAEVENEHAEALPASGEDEEDLSYQDDTAAWEETSSDADAADEAEQQDEDTPSDEPEALEDETPVVAEPAPPVPAEEPEPAAPAEEVREPWDEPVEQPQEPAEEQSSTGMVPDDRQIGLWQEPLPEEVAAPEPVREETVYAEADEETLEPVAAEPQREPWEIAHEAAATPSAPVADEAWRDEPEPLPVDAPQPVEPEPEAETVAEAAPGVDTAPRPYLADPLLDGLTDHEPLLHAGRDFTVSGHFEPEVLTAVPSIDSPAEPAPQPEPEPAPVRNETPPATPEPAAQQPAMPQALDLLDWDESAFDAPPAPQAAKPQVAEIPAAKVATAAAPTLDDGWSEFDDLMSPSGRAHARASDAGGLGDAAVGAPTVAPISYRAEPKRRNYKGIITGVLLVALLGGAGYGGWLYRDRIVELAKSMVKTGPAMPETAQKPATTPATGNGAATPTTAPANGNAANTGASNGTEVASAGNTQPEVTKFTQRLLADGTEKDSGPAQIAGQPATTEGKSVAEQNVAANVPPPATPGTPTAQTQTPTAPQTQPAQQTPPAVPGQGGKMFLYEERLGQSVPTAISGSVTWSLQEEAGENGKPEPTVQAQINVPERGLSALMTFKRNADPSLPASHLVEIVFSLPPNFEGGAIDSVQRIAMKTTEQDRGNPLIAVPAKITDDFHMIALNDFPEARATNLELLRTRNWIDMPVTYRNGRRALLTLEKGQAGTDAFNKAIQAWNALGPVGADQ